MSRSSPRIAVGVPVYNGERYMGEALEGLLAQTCGDFVVLISDNASTDGTRDICFEYARRDGRIQYVRRDTNRGAAWNLNALVEMATTPFFMWHAVDDVSRPRLLEACLTGLEREPGAVLAYTEAELIDERGQTVACKPQPLHIALPDVVRRFEPLLEPIGLSENIIYGLMRTETLKRTHRHGPFGGGDRALCAELSLYGPFVRIGEPLFRRRVRGVVVNEAETQSYNTGRRETFSLREWRVLRQNLLSIWSAPVARANRFRLYSAVWRRFLRKRRSYGYELKLMLKSRLGRAQ